MAFDKRVPLFSVEARAEPLAFIAATMAATAEASRLSIFLGRFKVRVERLIREWFEARTELNQKLEGIMASLWESSVIRPLERLSDESAGELPKDARPVNVVPFARAVSV